MRFASRDILTRLDGLPHLAVDSHPVGTTEHGTGAEESERIVLGTSIVDGNIPKHVFTNLLGQVNVDTQKVG